MRRLYDLDPEEVSLVPMGANKKKFLIYKSAKGKTMPQKDPAKDLRDKIRNVDPRKMLRVEKVIKGMRMTKSATESPEPVSREETYKAETNSPLSDGAQAALKAMARIAAPFNKELHAEHVGSVMKEVGIGGDGGNEGEGKTDMGMQKPEGVADEHHQMASKAADQAYMGHLEKMGYRKYPDAEMQQKSMDDVEKSNDEEDDEVEKSAVAKSAKGLDLSAFPKAQRPQLEKIFKSHQELVQKNLNLQTELKAERDHRTKKEFIAKAQSFKHLGADTEELASVMKTLSEVDHKAFEIVEKTLRAADTQISQGALFSNLGSSQSRAGGAGDAEAKLETLVDSVVQKSGNGKSRAEIYDDVIRNTPEGKRLYKEYKAGRPGGI